MSRFNNRLRSQTFSKKTLLIFLLLLPHFKPSYFQDYVPLADTLFNIGRVISGITLLIIILYKKHKVSGQLIFLMLSQVWLTINSWNQNGFTIGPFLFCLSNIIICMIIECYIEDAAKSLIHAFLILFELLLFINIITILLFPEGINARENWFLGYRNAFEITYVIALTCSFIWAQYTGKHIRSFLLVICIIYTSILSGSATGIIVAIMIPFLYYSKLYLAKPVQIKVVIPIYITIFIGIIFFGIQIYLSPIFEFFGRNITLTGRIYIWEVTMKSISESPFIGYGMQSAETRASMVRRAHAATSSHNFILEQLYNGGIILLILIILAFLHVYRELNNNKYHLYTHLLMIGVICYFTIMLVESVNYLHVYGFFFLAGHVNNIIRQMQVKGKTKNHYKNYNKRLRSHLKVLRYKI